MSKFDSLMNEYLSQLKEEIVSTNPNVQNAQKKAKTAALTAAEAEAEKERLEAEEAKKKAAQLKTASISTATV